MLKLAENKKPDPEQPELWQFVMRWLERYNVEKALRTQAAMELVLKHFLES